MNKKVIFKDLELIDYKKCWDYQEEIFAKTIEIKRNNRRKNTSVQTENTLIFRTSPCLHTW